MPRTTVEVHEMGLHRPVPRVRCPLCKAEVPKLKRDHAAAVLVGDQYLALRTLARLREFERYAKGLLL